MNTSRSVRLRRVLGRGIAASISGAALGSLLVAPSAAAGDAAPPVPPSLTATGSRHVLEGRVALVDGALSAAAGGHTVVVESSSSRGWRVVARVRTAAGGRFRARWRPSVLGIHRLRVTVADMAGVSAPAGRLTVYRSVVASFYGPGLYGGALACGGTLDAGTLGVANKTLPCGTRVSLRYRGRSVTVPVIDRGPYVAGRTYDLTSATKDRLGFPSTGVVWSSR